MGRIDMELEIPYHSDIDGFGCNDDSILSYMFGSFAFPNEKRKELHSNYTLTKTDKKIVNNSDGYPANNTVFPDNLEVSYRSGQFPNDLIVISSTVKDLNCDPLKRLNLDGNRRELLTGDKEKINGTMSSEEDVGGDFFSWSNDYKTETNNVRKVEESNNGYLSSGSITGGSVDTSAGKKRIWVDKSRELEGSPRKKKKIRTENGKDCFGVREGGGCRMPPWHVDEIENMAADLDGSLSALSTDLTAVNYNMSEALLSLPSLTVFKQEAPSPSQEGVLHHPNLQQNIEESHDHNTALQRLLQQQQQNFHSQIKRNNSSTVQSKTSEMSEKSENCRFQYVLAAATSIATKLTEETLTYLNQGQSYEIKLKKVGELSNFRGKILKGYIAVTVGLLDDDDGNVFMFSVDMAETVFCVFNDCTEKKISEEEVIQTAVVPQIISPYGLVTHSVRFVVVIFQYILGAIIYVFSDAETFSDVIDYIQLPKQPNIYSTITSLVLYEKPISVDPNPFHWLGKIWRMVFGDDSCKLRYPGYGIIWLCVGSIFLIVVIRFIYLRKISKDKEVIELFSCPKTVGNSNWECSTVDNDDTQFSLQLEVGSSSSNGFTDHTSDEDSIASSAIVCSVVSDILTHPCTERTEALVQDLTEDELKANESSVIRICFHERRLQYMEKEQILAWQASRPGERIVELDVPLSYGLFDVEQDPHMLNMLSFLWDPTKEVGAYIKVNCISTEFTPKKHGGEKGVPFRIQVETFIEGESTRLHAAACQIKVFKLKGADRKHKQDREKILKRPLSEQDKYQPPYECTVLSDLSPDAVFPAPTFLNSSASTVAISKPSMILSTLDGNDSNLAGHSPLRSPVSASVVSSSNKIDNTVGLCDILVERSRSPAPLPLECSKSSVSQLTPESNAQQTAQWLRKNSFGNYISTFSNFSGADILRLTRDDLIQICGLADGIRLLYALHSKAIVRLTVYFCTPGSTVFHAVYLNQIGRNEIARKLGSLLGIHHNQIRDIYMQGPNGIRVLVTDEVVGNIKDESVFSVKVLKDENCDRFMLLLKPASGGT